MIVTDDMNDWVGCLNGHPQTRTPNIDRLAARGVNFANAHCQAPLCNPSRASVLSGVLPSTTGVYDNLPTSPTEKLPEYWDRSRITTIGEHFGNNGYKTMGAGKLFHQCKWRGTFQEYGPPAGFSSAKTKVQTAITGGYHSDWGRIPGTDDETQDAKVASWAIAQLGKSHEQPFFLAVGFVRTHMPFLVPAKWFDLIGKEEDIQLPPMKQHEREGLPGNDLKVWPEAHTDYLELKEKGLMKSLIHAYLACIAFDDHQVGRVLEALDASPYAKNTLVVFWSDHGYHFGEKERLHKFTLWERSSRTPFVIAGPGIQPGRTCAQPVGLVDIFPTLCDLAGVPALAQFEGQSLRPQLGDVTVPHPPVSVTVTEGNHAIVTERYRYIRYSDGAEEFYDHQTDPNEWNNLARSSESRPLMDELAKALPKVNAPTIPKTKNAKPGKDAEG